MIPEQPKFVFIYEGKLENGSNIFIEQTANGIYNAHLKCKSIGLTVKDSRLRDSTKTMKWVVGNPNTVAKRAMLDIKGKLHRLIIKVKKITDIAELP